MLKASENLSYEIVPLTPEKFEEWYPLYEEEVVNKPGGKRNVARAPAGRAPHTKTALKWTTLLIR